MGRPSRDTAGPTRFRKLGFLEHRTLHFCAPLLRLRRFLDFISSVWKIISVSLQFPSRISVLTLFPC